MIIEQLYISHSADLNLHTNPNRRYYYYSHFTDGEIEAETDLPKGMQPVTEEPGLFPPRLTTRLYILLSGLEKPIFC